MNSFQDLEDHFQKEYENELRSLDGVMNLVFVVQEGQKSTHDQGIAIPITLQNQIALSLPAALSLKEKNSHCLVKAPAVCCGADLEWRNFTTTLPFYLNRAVEIAPAKGVHYINEEGGEDFQSYPQLLAQAQAMLQVLYERGCRTKEKIIFQVNDNQLFITLFWACVIGGFVPVPLACATNYREKNAATQKLGAILQALDGAYIATTASLSRELAYFQREHGIDSGRLIVLHAEAGAPEITASEPVPSAEVDENDITIILPTSGSTGTPKLVQQRHVGLLARSLGTIQHNHFTGEEISLNWMPLDHVGGIIMWHLKDVILACEQYHAYTQHILENPLRWLDYIDQFRATLTWAPNFAYGLVDKKLAEINHVGDSKPAWDLSCMAFILNAGEAIVSKTARQFLTILAPYGLPATCMNPVWGMSETSSGVVYNNNFRLETSCDSDQFVKLGGPIPGLSIRITNEKDELLFEGEEGHLQVKGLSVTPGYYQDSVNNKKSFTADGWFRTGDLGVIERASLTIIGRSKDQIIINGANYYAHEIESLVEEVEGVERSYTAAVAVRCQEDDTDRLAIFFHNTDESWQAKLATIRKIKACIVKNIRASPSYVLPLEKQQIEKTSIGKIQRQKLANNLKDGVYQALFRKIEAADGRSLVTIPDWFFIKKWHASDSLEGDACKALERFKTVMVLMDEHGVGEYICENLKNSGVNFLKLYCGRSFQYINAQHYILDPNSESSYRRLEEKISLDSSGFNEINGIVNLWCYGKPPYISQNMDLFEEQVLGCYSLLNLFKHCFIAERKQTLELFLVTSFVQCVADGDGCRFGQSTLNGLMKTLPMDLPWVHARHIDFLHENGDCERLLSEISYQPTTTTAGIAQPLEIAYRHGQRFLSYLEKLTIDEKKLEGVFPFEPGIYVIVGGFGALGLKLAEYLLGSTKIKLLIIGRTALPEKRLWEQTLASQQYPSKHIERYLTLADRCRETGAEFRYEPVDICDKEKLASVLADVSSEWQAPLRSVFHLAGEFDTRAHWQRFERHRIGEEVPEYFERLFTAKVYGCWNILEVLRSFPDSQFIAFSSIAAEFGGTSFSAYSAASSFMEACCAHFRKQGQKNIFCFHWSMWEGLGMNEHNPEYIQAAAREHGHMHISPENGWYSLLLGIAQAPGSIYIGLDKNNEHIRKKYPRHQKPNPTAVLFINHSDALNRQALDTRIENIAAALACPIEVKPVKEIPLLKSGVVDLEALLESDSSGNGEQLRQLSREEIEHSIVQLWKKMTHMDTVDPHGNLFEQGGNSIIFAQCAAEIKKISGKRFSITDFYSYSSIAELVKYLVPLQQPKQPDQVAASSERGSRRRALLAKLDKKR